VTLEALKKGVLLIHDRQKSDQQKSVPFRKIKGGERDIPHCNFKVGLLIVNVHTARVESVDQGRR